MASSTKDLILWRPGERSQLQPRRAVIGGLVSSGEAVLLLGPPKSGKSALAVEAATCVAAGAPLLGRNTRQGAVIYVAGERFAETDLRLALSARGRGDIPVRLARARLGGDDDDSGALISAMKRLAAETQTDPALLIFDTANALLRDVDGDENSARSIGRLTLAIDRVREGTGAAVMVVHHAKRGENRARGSDAFEGWADTVAIVGGKLERRELKVVRSNLLEEGVVAQFRLAPIDLGEDPVTGTRSSAVLARAVDEAGARKHPAKLPPDAEAALRALRTLPDPSAVSEWRAATMTAYEGRPEGAKRQAFSTAKKRLAEQGLIIVEGDIVSVSARQQSVSTHAC